VRLAAGAPAGADERWLNWVVRREPDGALVGTAQATVRADHALIAWVIAVPFQGRGYAKAAARAVVALLDVPAVAHIHPDHAASEAVARAAGLVPTEDWTNGERVWKTSTARPERPTG
jgi:RimJ/RimL family protein N-acetyltransferase